MATKSYSQPDKSNQHLNEPRPSYGLSADHLRMEMMREALRIEDTNLLHEALEYLRALVKPQRYPCQYSLAELNKRLDMAEEEERLGLGCTTEELLKRHPR